MGKLGASPDSVRSYWLYQLVILLFNRRLALKYKNGETFQTRNGCGFQMGRGIVQCGYIMAMAVVPRHRNITRGGGDMLEELLFRNVLPGLPTNHDSPVRMVEAPFRHVHANGVGWEIDLVWMVSGVSERLERTWCVSHDCLPVR